MKTVYLHIGLHKTGSTTIQHFLAENEERLAELGYCLPMAGRTSNRAVAHHNFGTCIMRKGAVEVEENAISKLLKEAEQTSCPKILISTETLERARPDKLASLFPGYKRVLVAYIRRQDAIAASKYVQQSKSVNAETFRVWLERWVEANVQNYAKLYRKWAETDSEVRIRILETRRLHRGDLISDFLKTIDVPESEPNTFQSIQPRNEGLSDAALHFLLVLNTHLNELSDRDFRIERVIRRTLIGATDHCFSQRSKFSPLDDETRNTILAAYQKSNDWLSEKLFGKPGQLFEPLETGSRVSNTPGSVGEVTGFFFYILHLLHARHPAMLESRVAARYLKQAFELAPALRSFKEEPESESQETDEEID